MELNSCLYEANVFHQRLKPKPHQFSYKVFVFCLDLTEEEVIQKNLRFLSWNRWNLFSFREKDHLTVGKANLLDNVKSFVRESGIQTGLKKILLVTNVRILGYVFNPVSFYFCFDSSENLVCAIPEVGNTFGEIKPYIGLINPKSQSTFQEPDVKLVTPKDFYVSPFVSLDSEFEFLLNIPKDRLSLAVHSNELGERVLNTVFAGKKIPLNDSNLLKLFFRFPFLTVQIIAAIHFQAFLLWWKKIPFIRKNENMEKQTGVPLGQISQPSFSRRSSL